MKTKYLLSIFILVLFVILRFVFQVNSSSRNIKIIVDGRLINFTQNTGFPILDDNRRVLVPFRAVLEEAGIMIKWDNQFKKVIATKENIQLHVPIGNQVITKYHLSIAEEILIDSPAIILNGRTYLPIRKSMEALGFEVGWIDSTSTVTIDSLDKDYLQKEIISDAFDNKLGDNVYYRINQTTDSQFNFKDPDSYKIFKTNGDIKAKLTNHPAYELTVLGDEIYFMKIEHIERTIGVLQKGTLWKVNNDGSNEQEIFDDSIYTLTSDGNYLYFTGETNDRNLMKMVPGGKPEIFASHVKTGRILHSKGWIYYVDEKDGYSISRINLKTKKTEKVTRQSPFEYMGYKFLIVDNHIVMPTYDNVSMKNIVAKINVDSQDTKQTNLLGYQEMLHKNGEWFFYSQDKKVFELP